MSVWLLGNSAQMLRSSFSVSVSMTRRSGRGVGWREAGLEDPKREARAATSSAVTSCLRCVNGLCPLTFELV